MLVSWFLFPAHVPDRGFSIGIRSVRYPLIPPEESFSPVAVLPCARPYGTTTYVELDTYVLLKAYDFSGKKRPYYTMFAERRDIQAFPEKDKNDLHA
jgi:hypothetical protein